MRHLKVFVWLILLLACVSLAEGYEQPDHRQITERSAVVSSLGQTLKDLLGLEGGIGETFPGSIMKAPRTVQQLLGDGAVQEDVPILPIPRVRNHFHNPLLPWDQAGLRILGVQVGQSSVLWQQNPTQDSMGINGGQWAWHDARVSYFAALTGTEKADRDQAFAKTFETLGHTAHLLQDASVPAHVRNDQHLVYEGYEKWVDKRRTVTGTTPFLDSPISSTVVPTATGNSQAPVGVARLIDADVYTGANGDILAGTGLGLAEYTNGNFFSGDTICRDFPFPRCPQSPLLSRAEEVGGGAKRIYYAKPGGGDPIDHLVVEGTFLQTVINRGLLEAAPAYVLDDRVYQDYAAKLIPRAVGYSAGLLDYFFRGTLDFELTPDSLDPSQAELTVINTSAATMDGSFTLYWDDENGIRTPIAQMSTSLDPWVTSPRVTFAPPAGAEAFVVVFLGTLGDEEQAVAAKVKPGATVIFPVQDSTQLLGEPEREENIWQYGEDWGWILLSNLGGKQLITGTFVKQGKKPTGKDLRRVEVTSLEPVTLLLDGQPVDGMIWNRGTSEAPDPTTWTILTNFYSAHCVADPAQEPAPYNCWDQWILPKFLRAETVGGVEVVTPLVVWDGVSSGGYHLYASYLDEYLTYTRKMGSLLYAGTKDWTYQMFPVPISNPETYVGFVPLDADGHPVGIEEDDQIRYSNTVFAYRQAEDPVVYWNKNDFAIYPEKGYGHAVPEPPAISPPPPVRLKRFYRPDELLRFRLLGVRVPDDGAEITLR